MNFGPLAGRRLHTLVLVAVALWVRLSRIRDVFVGGEVIPVEGDCYYHLRRSILALASYPHVPVHDPFIDWPNGADALWAPGFDQLEASIILLAGQAHDPHRARQVAALVPVVLGVGVVLATMALARKLLDRDAHRDASAFAAGWIVALLPQSVAISIVGRIDHHVIEALLVALLLRWLLVRPSPEHPTSKGTRMFEAQGAALVALGIHVFSGSLLYFGMAAGLLVLACLLETGPSPSILRGLLGSGAPAFLTAAIALALAARSQVAEHGHALHHMYPSFLQPLLVAFAGLCIALAAVVRSRIYAPKRTAGLVARRVGALVGCTVPLLVLAIFAAPKAFGELSAGVFGWVGKENVWMASIVETQPLFRHEDIWTWAAWSQAWDEFGLAGLLCPLLLPVAVLYDQKRAAGRNLSFWAFTAGLIVLTLVQNRFGRALVVCIAVWTALALRSLAASLGETLNRPSRPTRIGLPALLAICLAALVACDPRLRTYFVPTRSGLTAIDGAALFVRDHTPPVRPHAASGVLAPWDMGFPVIELGERPVVESGFGPYLSLASHDDTERAWRGTERELMALMDRRDLGYVVAGAAAYYGSISGPHGEAPFTRAPDARGIFDDRYFRAFPLSAMIAGGSGAPESGVRHLEHLLPRYASPQQVGGLSFAVPRLWVFERVAGARVKCAVRGTNDPNAQLVADLDLQINDRPMHYTAWSDIHEGEAVLNLPLPTAYSGGGIRSAAEYHLRVGDSEVARTSVPEAAVRSGSEIAIP